MAGLTAAGFTPKTLSEIKTDMENRFKASFGENFDVSPETVAGQLIGTLAERLAELWELAETVNAEASPDAATGARLEALAALTGTIKEAAAPSTATLTATGGAATLLPLGRVVSVSDTGKRFATDAAATLAAVPAWTLSTVYALGARVTNGASPARVYQCTAGGTSAGAGGPTGTTGAIADNTVTWAHLGEGAAAADVAVTAEATGPTIGVARTLTTIETPVTGWKGAINVADAELGSDLETDPNLRLRREDEIRGGAAAANAAIRSKILKVADVEACTVFGNRSMVTDGDGMPPKSVECLVRGGTDEEVRAAVFANIAEGIESHGSNSGTVTDPQGTDHTIKFSRPTEVPIYVIVHVDYDADLYPSDGDAQIKALIVAWGALFATGRDVRSAPAGARSFDVTGVIDVTATYIGTAPAPASEATIAIAARSLATFDTSRVSVVGTPGVP